MSICDPQDKQATPLPPQSMPEHQMQVQRVPIHEELITDDIVDVFMFADIAASLAKKKARDPSQLGPMIQQWKKHQREMKRVERAMMKLGYDVRKAQIPDSDDDE